MIGGGNVGAIAKMVSRWLRLLTGDHRKKEARDECARSPLSHVRPPGGQMPMCGWRRTEYCTLARDLESPSHSIPGNRPQSCG